MNDWILPLAVVVWMLNCCLIWRLIEKYVLWWIFCLIFAWMLAGVVLRKQQEDAP